MADNTRDLLFRFLGDARDLSAASTKAKSSLAGVEKTASKTKGSLSGTAGAAKAFGAAVLASGVVRFLGDATQAALEDQKAQEMLALALENSTDATAADISKLEDWITKTSLATGVADDELRPALAELARTTGDLETAQETLGVAMDIAAAKGIPLETVTKAIGKAALGNIGALGRLGVATKDASGKTLSFEDALAEAARTMGGATATAAGTAAGKMAILKVQMDETKESIGNFLIPILSDLAQQGSDTMKVMGFLGDKIGDMLPGSEGLGSSIMEWVGPLKVSGKLMEIAAGMVDDMTASTEAANRVIDVSADRYDDMGKSVDDATVAIQDFEDAVRSQIDPVFAAIDAMNGLTEAQAGSGRARDEYNEGSPQHLEALRKEAEASLRLKDALLKMADESGLTRDKYGQHLRDMKVFTETEIALMLAEFDKLDGLVVDTTIRINRHGDIIGNDRGGDTRRAAGGRVPGPRGQPRTIIAHGGEEVINPRLGQTSGGGVSIVVNGFVGNESQLAAEIDRMLTRRARQSGLGFQ